MTEEETELTSRQKLERYEYAGLAGKIFKDQSRSAYSLEAMRMHYFSRSSTSCFGLDEDDPAMNDLFAQAYAGVESGQITNSGIFKAIELYAEKYDNAFAESKVSDFMDYVADKGYDEIPDKLKSLIDKYKDSTIEELGDKAKEAKKSGDRDKLEEYTKVIKALGTLRNYVLEGVLYTKLIEKSTKQNLESLVEERVRGRRR